MRTKPDLITFTSRPHHVKTAIANGATELILEHPSLSIRSFCLTLDDEFSSLSDLAQLARGLEPSISLSVMCDFMLHAKHEPLLFSVIPVLRDLDLTHLRVQDPGLIVFFQHHYPEANCTLGLEMGNMNVESVLGFSEIAASQTLSNECPHASIQTLIKATKLDFDLQVQGPVLIQYSYRRYLAGLSDEKQDTKKPDQVIKTAEDLDYPKRPFKFLDNPHGHFMFAPFDRCLISSKDNLLNLALRGWIVDARGESDAYFDTAIQLYRGLLDGHDIEPLYETFLTTTQRPQKSGFFNANQTDRGRYSRLPKQPEEPIGRLLHVMHKGHVIADIWHPEKLENSCYVITQKGKKIMLPSSETWERLDELYTLPFFKGAVAKMAIYPSSLG